MDNSASAETICPDCGKAVPALGADGAPHTICPACGSLLPEDTGKLRLYRRTMAKRIVWGILGGAALVFLLLFIEYKADASADAVGVTLYLLPPILLIAAVAFAVHSTRKQFGRPR
ncbi:MAG: hypothetical protein LBR73_04760 [Oscillospiraceae bacterium]|nr:hypothetical protein [Oscillospiraceae bacterium]